MSTKDATGLVIGGEPRIDFLPPEVKERKNARKARRGLIALVVIVMVACAGGYVFATSLALQSQGSLADEQAKTAALLAEQAEYAEVRTVAAQLAAVKDARLVATAAEILWIAQLAELQATLPAGMVITTAEIDSISATELAPVAAVPLEQERVATLTLTATAPSLSAIADWLDNLRDLRGYADAWGAPAFWDGDHYEVDVRLNINAEAFAKRYFEVKEAVASEEDEAEEASTTEESEVADDAVTPSPSAPSTENEG
jgi:hypothetical protein